MPPTDTACTLFNVFDLGLPDQGAVGEEPYRTGQSRWVRMILTHFVILVRMVRDTLFGAGVLDRSMDPRHEFRR